MRFIDRREVTKKKFAINVFSVFNPKQVAILSSIVYTYEVPYTMYEKLKQENEKLKQENTALTVLTKKAKVLNHDFDTYFYSQKVVFDYFDTNEERLINALEYYQIHQNPHILVCAIKAMAKKFGPVRTRS